MENQENQQQRGGVKGSQCGCFKPSSRLGKMMMKMIKKMCGWQDNEEFSCKDMVNKMNCCSDSK